MDFEEMDLKRIREEYLHLPTLVLEKRIQIIESIVANSEMNEGILNFLEESASNKS